VTPTLASALAAMAPGYSDVQHRKVAKAMEKDMQAKHTPGWGFSVSEVQEDDEGSCRVILNTDVHYNQSNASRVGDLAEAAPDLLAALENIIGLVDKMDAWNDTRDEIQHAARAAIAKAKGVRNG
jgi:hypothetical protein